MRFLTICLIFVWSASFGLVAAPKALSRAPSMTLQDMSPDKLAFETAEDGTRYLAVRLKSREGAATRLHITGMRLAAGEKLYIYSADGAHVYGPFEGAGPVQTGEFLSGAIPGTEVIVEFQAGHQLPADLPFTIRSIEPTNLLPSPVQKEQGREVRTSLYGGIPVTHEVVDGMAVYEGDILLGRADELAPALPGIKKNTKSSVAITGLRYRWPNGRMPYEIDPAIPSQHRIVDAIAHWNSVMAGTVQIVPRTSETNYVRFVPSASSGTCSSYVGMVGSRQTVNVGSSCSKGNVIHEIGHALGLWHEHTREDRNDYVTINWDNITSSASYNFSQNIATGDDIGSYDYNSIMHYHATSFSRNGLPTIVTIPPGIPIGQRGSLSVGDIEGIKVLYPSSSVPATVSTTVTTNPAGLPIVVDGADYISPAAFVWDTGSSHTISAPAETLLFGMRATFAKWSDAGAPSHTVIASSATPMFKADYAVAYTVKAKPYPFGAATLTPASDDGFYPAGATVTASANPAPGHCFTNWTGLIGGTPNRAALTVLRAYDLQANFQPGSITLTVSKINAPAAGGTYAVGVSASSGCTWGTYSTDPWVAIAAGQSGSGSGTITLVVAPNKGTTSRTAQISIGYKSFLVTQPGVR
jgi:Astacin (Peptidase family M12A)/Divergent InlB B-repeat domain